MASLRRYSGLNDLNNAWLARLGIVLAGAVLCAVADYLMGHHILMTIIALVIYFFGIFAFVYSGILAILVYYDIDTDARSDDDYDWIQNLILFSIIVIAILMVWVDWKWFAAIAAFGSFANPSSHTDVTPKWWRALFIGGVAAIVIIQLWLNTALIHLMASGESIITNSHVETQAPFLAALGFGLGTARWVSVRGANRVAVFLIASLVFFYGQRFVVDSWAETRSAEIQNRAIASLMLGNRLAMLGDGGQAFLNADDRLEAMFKTAILPGKLTLMGFPSDYYRYVRGNDASLLSIKNELLSYGNYVRFKPKFDDMKQYYQGYLTTKLVGLTNENLAQQVARMHFPMIAGDVPLTRGAIADKILAEIWEKTPEAYRNQNDRLVRALNSRNGRSQIESNLARYQLSMPSRWRFESYAQFRELLMGRVDARADQIRAQLNAADFNPGEHTIAVAGMRLMTWRAFTQAQLELVLPSPTAMGEGYTFNAYKEDIEQVFAQNTGYDLAKGLYRLHSFEKKGTPVKAAIMPFIGIFASFAFLMAMVCVVGHKLLYRVLRNLRGTLYNMNFCSYLAYKSYYEKGRHLETLLNKHVPLKFKLHVLIWIFALHKVDEALGWLLAKKRLAVCLLALIGFYIFSVGLENAYLQWQQIPYIFTAIALKIVGMEPGFPSIVPDFLL